MISPSGGVPEWGLDWFFVAIEACGSGTSDLSTPLGFLEYLGIYRVKRRCRGATRWAQPPWARLGLLARPGGLCSPRASPLAVVLPAGCLLVQEIPPKKFLHVWTPVGIDFLRSKKQEKTATRIGHYVNRLVPKMI